MIVKSQGNRDESGSALLAALLVVMTVGALSATTLQMQMSRLRAQETANDRKRAFYLAEAGLAEALLSLRTGGTGQVGTMAAPAEFGTGYLFTSAVEDSHGNFVVESTGIGGSARHRLSLSVERQVVAPGSLGFFGADELVVGGGAGLTLVDSVDAEDKKERGVVVPKVLPAVPLPAVRYDGPVYPDALGPKFGSNGQVQIQGASASQFTDLDGDLLLGPTTLLDWQLGATIGGATAPQEEDLVLPELVWPTFTPAGDLTVAAGTVLPLPMGDTHYGDVLVQTTGQLSLVGPLVASFDTLTLAPGATISVDSTAGPVELHVAASVVFSAGSSVANVALDAGGLTLVVHADDTLGPAVTNALTGEFRGVLYAPLAALEIPAGLTWVGAAVGRTLTIPEDAVLQFDTAVLNEVAAQIFYEPISWNILPVPAAIANPITYSPGATYRAAGIVAALPVQALGTIDQVVRYVGNNGEEYVYRGEAGALDMSDVAVVVDTFVPADAQFNKESQFDGQFFQP